MFFPEVFVNEVFAKVIFFKKYSKLRIQTVEILKSIRLILFAFFESIQ